MQDDPNITLAAWVAVHNQVLAMLVKRLDADGQREIVEHLKGLAAAADEANYHQSPGQMEEVLHRANTAARAVLNEIANVEIGGPPKVDI